MSEEKTNKILRFEDMPVWQDRSHFYYIALGSLLETKNFIYLSEKLCYVKRSEADVIIIKIESIHKQITAILGYFKKHV